MRTATFTKSFSGIGPVTVATTVVVPVPVSTVPETRPCVNSSGEVPKKFSTPVVVAVEIRVASYWNLEFLPWEPRLDP